MTSKNLFVCIAAALVLVALFATSASAFAKITDVEVNGVDNALEKGVRIAEFAGEEIPVEVQFKAFGPGKDVRVKAWISGEAENAAVTERFDLIPHRTYARTLFVELPSDLDERINRQRTLNILIETIAGRTKEVSIPLTIQRESYNIEILDVDFEPTVRAGELLTLDVVLENIGGRLAEDNFVSVSIPALGVQERVFFGDLSAVDESDPDREDTEVRTISVRIPENAPAGVYAVNIEAFNDDSSDVVTRNIAVEGAEADTIAVAPTTSKTFGVGETGEYSLTLVNTGSNVKIFQLGVASTGGLDVEVSNPVVVVPAGSSQTVTLNADADEAGRFEFTVDVSSDSKLVAQQNFVANVEETGNGVDVRNATVLLTIVLAVVFVVLLVVLIVLLTRKPQRSEEFGESYY